MRIALAGLNHETNTYCSDPTPASAFYKQRGTKLLKNRGTETSAGGAIAACEQKGIELVPIFSATTQPSGTIERAAFDEFSDEILQGLRAAGELDAIFLDLHGAGVVEGIDDLEGALCEIIRAEYPETPMAATFDLHGNITQNMVDQLDGVFACHQYPHVDLHIQAEEAIDLLHEMVTTGKQTTRNLNSLPMLQPTTTTFEGIGKEMLEAVLKIERESGVIDISWFHGFPYTDVPHVGVHIVVTAWREHSNAEQVARAVAEKIWVHREKFKPESLDADAVLAKAVASNALPVVINETSDNPGGGSPGDGTHLLRAMLDQKLEDACFGFIVDPDVAEQAHKAGVGADINISLGGKYDALHGDPLNLNAYVKSLHDGKLTMLAMFKGAPIHYGKLARLVVDGIDVIVASRRSQTFDIGPFMALGIDVSAKKIVALKSSNHFRAGFTELAGTILTADTPGLTTHQVHIFERQNIDKPLWPLDDSIEISF